MSKNFGAKLHTLITLGLCLLFMSMTLSCSSEQNQEKVIIRDTVFVKKTQAQLQQEAVNQAIKELNEKKEAKRVKKRAAFAKALKDSTNLRKLVYTDDTVKTIPPEIGRMKNLEVLDLRELRLESLPSEIGNLSNLKELYLFRNHLKKLPPEIAKLTKLEKLYLGGNDLTQLPPEIGKLKNLKILTFDYNYLTSIPPEIAELGQLENLYIGYNKIEHVPLEIGRLKNSLKKLDGIVENEISWEEKAKIALEVLPNTNFVNFKVGEKGKARYEALTRNDSLVQKPE